MIKDFYVHANYGRGHFACFLVQASSDEGAILEAKAKIESKRGDFPQREPESWFASSKKNYVKLVK